MSVRLEVAQEVAATPERLWAELADWTGQGRWIPATRVRVLEGPEVGVGGRVEALSGFRLGPVPVGLLDRFVVTGWTPPGSMADQRGELAVLHLGPYFTGEGSFKVEPTGAGSRLVATELFSLPGGRPVEALARLALPLMRAGFALSLRRLARLAESPR